MDSVGSRLPGQYSRHALTDLTLSFVQDSGWYDVKYGAAGWNPLGYHAGCAFALGTYLTAWSSRAARPYLCSDADEGVSTCLPDFSGDGMCKSSPTWDGFYRPTRVRAATALSSGASPDQ